MKHISLFVLCMSLAGCHVNLSGNGDSNRNNRQEKPGIRELSGNYNGNCSIIGTRPTERSCYFSMAITNYPGNIQTVRVLVHGLEEYWFSFHLGDGLNVVPINSTNVNGVFENLNPGYDVTAVEPRLYDGGNLTLFVKTKTKFGDMDYSFKMDAHKYGVQFEINDSKRNIYLSGSSIGHLPTTLDSKTLVVPIFKSNNETAFIFMNAEKVKSSSSSNAYRGVRMMNPVAKIGEQNVRMIFTAQEFCEHVGINGIYTAVESVVTTETVPQGQRVVRLTKESQSLVYQLSEPEILANDATVPTDFICSGGTF